LIEVVGARMHAKKDSLQTLKTKSDLHIARKIWHFLGVLTILMLYHNLNRQQGLSMAVFLIVLSFSIDLIRLRFSMFNHLVIQLMGPILREREKQGYSGLTAMSVGVFIVVYLFPDPIVKLSLLCLAIADPAASYYGVKYGKDKIFGHKSLQGAIAAFVACVFICASYFFLHNLMTERILIVSLLAGLSGALSEAVTIGRIDDNFSFPVVNSFLLYVLFQVFGGL
jgi:dolichol kinase